MPKRDFQTGTQDLMRMQLGSGPYEWLQMSYDPELDTLVSNPITIITQTFQIAQTTSFEYIGNANAIHVPWRIYVDHELELQLRATMLMRNIDGAGNEQQTVTITGTPTGGTFRLTFDGQQTGTIAHNANAATVQTALEALSNIDPGDVAVTGGPGPDTPYVVEFRGQYAYTDVPEMTATHTFTGGSSPDVSVSTTVVGGVRPNEVRSIWTTGSPTGGTFTLWFDAQETGTIAHNASAATIQSALEALSNIAPGDVACAGGPLPTTVTVTFQGAYANTDVPDLVATNQALTGGSSPFVFTDTPAPGVVAGLAMRSADLGGFESDLELNWIVDLDPAITDWTLQSTGWGGHDDWRKNWGQSPIPPEYWYDELPLADYLRVAPQLFVDDSTRGECLGFTGEMRVIQP